MMKYIRILSIVLTLISSLAYGKMDTSPQNQELFVLKSLYNTQLVLDEINLASINALKKCLQNEESNHFYYENKYLEALGEDLVSVKTACSKIVDDMLLNPIKETLPKIRLHLALSEPQYREDNPIFSESFGETNQVFQWNKSLSHVAWGFSDVKLAELTADEIKNIKKVYQKSQSQFCQAYINGRFENDLSLLEYKQNKILNFINKNELCNDLLSGVDLVRNNHAKSIDPNDLDSLQLLQKLAQKYYHRAYKIREKWRSLQRRYYYSYISQYPFLIYLDIDKIEKSDLLYALTQIQNNAQRRLNTHVQLNNQLNKSNDDFREKALEYVNFEITNEYTKFFLRKDNTYPDNYEEIIDSLRSAYLDQQKSKMLKTTTLIVGLNLSCFLFFNKLPLKNACFAALGLPVNSYFLYSALKQNHMEWMEYLSTVDGEKYLKEYDYTLSSRRMAFIELFILPLGIQAKYITQQLRQLIHK